MFLSGAIVIAGVQKGIERYTKMMMPLLLLIVIILGVRACTLEGAGAGLKFLFYPKFSELTGNSILSALGQAFFSLSIGMGVLLTYASYIRKDDNLNHISLQVITTDTLVAVLAGVAILPAVFAFHIDPQAGPGLVFLTLPKVFLSMPLGQLWSVLRRPDFRHIPIRSGSSLYGRGKENEPAESNDHHHIGNFDFRNIQYLVIRAVEGS